MMAANCTSSLLQQQLCNHRPEEPLALLLPQDLNLTKSWLCKQSHAQKVGTAPVCLKWSCALSHNPELSQPQPAAPPPHPLYPSWMI